MTITNTNLEEQYRFTRAALVVAGLDMNDSIDALYRDWRRWRDKLETMVRVDSVAVGKVDEWWAQHLVQFRCLIDPLHVTARAVRAQKDSVVRVRTGRAVPLAILRSPASTQSDPNMNLCKRADEEHHD